MVQSVRIYAEAASARVAHLRTQETDRKIDLIVEGEDRRIVAIEVKLLRAGGATRHVPGTPVLPGTLPGRCRVVAAFQDIVARHEGKTFERKRSTEALDSILRAIVAFANTAGGTLVVGIDDDGTVRGVDDPLGVQEQIVNALSHGIAPLLVPEFSILEDGGYTLVTATIHPSDRRPHHVTREGTEAGTYVRVGASNRRADQPMREQLVRSARRHGFDEEPAYGVDIDELEPSLVLERIGRSDPEALQTLDLVTTSDGAAIPTNAGVLLAAPSVVAERFPNACVHAAAFSFDGNAALVRRTIGGCLFEIVDRSIDFVREMTGTRVEVIAGQTASERVPIVPVVALRELVINAIVHADYALDGGPLRVAVHPDRVVIENPGMLVTGLVVDDLGDGVSRIRNRAIARVFREAGYIEQWGSGIRRARADATAAGVDLPTLEEVAPYRFRATIHTIATRPPDIDPLSKQLISYVVASPSGMSTSELAQLSGKSERTVRDRMAALVDLGLVAAAGRGPQRRYVPPGAR